MQPHRFTIPLLIASVLSARSTPLINDDTRLRVHVYKTATLPDDVVNRAEKESSHLLGSAVTIEWLNCTPFVNWERASGLERGDMIVRILPHNKSEIRASVLGQVLTANTGVSAEVFLDRISLLQSQRVSIASVLGKVMAHEITHLLMGADSHAPTGMMRPMWSSGELSFVRKMLWFFTPEQQAAMHEQLQKRLSASCEDVK